MNGDKNYIDRILEIYRIYSDDNQKYNTMIWQFPTAILSLNIVAINFFQNKPCALLIVSFFNFILIHALFKQVHNQRAIINALLKIEDRLREYYELNMIPDFTPKSRIMKIKSSYLLTYSLLFMNFVFLGYILWRLLYR
jgi:hypothetical protein